MYDHKHCLEAGDGDGGGGGSAGAHAITVSHFGGWICIMAVAAAAVTAVVAWCCSVFV